jgi:hypothetical protein
LTAGFDTGLDVAVLDGLGWAFGGCTARDDMWRTEVSGDLPESGNSVDCQRLSWAGSIQRGREVLGSDCLMIVSNNEAGKTGEAARGREVVGDK